MVVVVMVLVLVVVVVVVECKVKLPGKFLDVVMMGAMQPRCMVVLVVVVIMAMILQSNILPGLLDACNVLEKLQLDKCYLYTLWLPCRVYAPQPTANDVIHKTNNRQPSTANDVIHKTNNRQP